MVKVEAAPRKKKLRGSSDSALDERDPVNQAASTGVYPT